MHLFVGCEEVKKIWTFFVRSFGDANLEKFSLGEKIIPLRTLGLSYVGRLYHSLCFHATVWCVWLEHNCRIFEGKAKKVEQIINVIKEEIWSWG